MRYRFYSTAAVIAAVMACAACSTPAVFRPFSGQFPSKAELDKLKLAVPGEIPVGGQVAFVETYTPQASAPAEPSGRATYAEIWARPFVEVADAAQGRVYPSLAMRCLAEELGKFYLAHQATPTPALEQHLAAGCGVTDPGPASYYYGGEVPAAATDAEVIGQWAEPVKRAVEEALTGGMFSAGFWFGRDGGRAAVAAVYSRRRALLTEVRRDGNDITIKGQILDAFERLEAMITRGEYAFAHCAIDAAARLPRFAFTCTVDPTDPAAYVELVGFLPGRFLGEALVIHRQTGPSFAGAYRAPPPSPAAGADVDAALLAAINAWRRRAGLAALVPEQAQSEVNRTAAPHYYAGIFGRQSVIAADWIALGLVAGWDVAGTVVEGSLSSRWQANSSDVSSLVEAMTQLPFDRKTLLSPRATRVAIGTLALGEHLGVLVTTYELFERTDRKGLTAAALTSLNRARRQAGRNPVRPTVEAMEEAALAAGRMEDPAIDPGDAVQRGLAEVSERTGRAVQSWVIPMSGGDLDNVTFPEDLVTADDLMLGISAAFYRDPSAPWGAYYLLVYVVGGGRAV